MSAFATDIAKSLRSEANVPIDIGLTKEPYYTDKSTAIEREGKDVYGSEARHVHLVGYDTLIRFCNPKYYPNHTPPLSALRPFFEAGHRLRVTQRPEDAGDASSKEFGSVEEQEGYLRGIKEGGLEKEGFEAGWRDSIEMVEGTGVGVSSTRVRNAAKEGRWDEVGGLCTEGVAEWLRDQELYGEDASGKKMMG